MTCNTPALLTAICASAMSYATKNDWARIADPRRKRTVRRVTAMVLLAGLPVFNTVTISYGAEVPASPPCDGIGPQPPYAAIGDAPNVRVWKDQTLPRFAASTECSGWAAATFRTLIAVAGTLQTTDEPEVLLSRFGQVSGLLLVRYWSTTDQTWRPLVVAATALTQKIAGRPRADFTVAELKGGQDVYLAQKDSRGSSAVIYRMRVREGLPHRFIIETENVTSVRLWALTLFKPSDLRSVYFIEKSAPGTWRYYGLTGIADGSWLVAGHEASYINRAVAIYRHFAGIRTDLEPPAAR